MPHPDGLNCIEIYMRKRESYSLHNLYASDCKQ